MSSTLVTPLLIYRAFGTNAANPTYINLPIPDPSQISITVNAASFADGFPPSTMTPEASGGLPFFGQDMNGILWMISAYCANFAAGALSSYNSTLSGNISGYPLGAVLVNAAGNGIWISQVDGNTTDPDTGGAGWYGAALVGSSGVALSSAATVTLTPAQYSAPYIAFTGTLSTNVNVIFPAAAGQQWVVANLCTGSFTVTVKTASGSGVVVPATGAAAPTSIYCDSANIQNTGVSTAGLAPINSPALTGTPTAPTASPATTNTTQIATTAFVQAAITAALSIYARLASPIFSGVPTTPTAAPGTNTLQIASTAFVTAAISAATTALETLFKGGQQGPMPSGTAFVTVTYSTPFPTATLGVAATPTPTAGAIIVRDYSGSGPPTDPRGFQVASESAGIYVSWVAVGN